MWLVVLTSVRFEPSLLEVQRPTTTLEGPPGRSIVAPTVAVPDAPSHWPALRNVPG
jgi:hypothetical protein